MDALLALPTPGLTEGKTRMSDRDAEAIENPSIAGPLRFDRRLNDRWTVHGVATAFRVSGDRFGHMHELRLTDLSHEGLGALSDSVIEPGTTVTLGFSNPGYLARRGTVVRCLPCGEGYRVAVRFEHRLAA
jgi:hypothetical protein